MHPWTEWLRICRRNLGSRTGDFWKENRQRLEISPLLRPGRKDPLDRLWKDQELLFTRGELQLAILVKPDEDATRPAWAGRPTLIVHSPDPRFAAAPHQFEELVMDLPYVDPPDSQIETLLDDGSPTTARASWIPVPESLARGTECYLSVVYLPHKAMPDRWLGGEMFPVLCLRDETPAIAMLPWEYWPAELVQSWREVEAPGPITEHEQVVVRGYGWPTFVCFLGPILAFDAWFELTTGEVKRPAHDPGRFAIGLAIGAMALFLFDRHDRRRAAESRYFCAYDGRPISVTLSRRFGFLLPRTWCYVAFGYLALWTTLQLLR